MSFAQIAYGLAANLEAITPECQVSPWPLAEPTPPTLQVVLPGDIDYDLAMRRGGDQVSATIQGFVPFQDAGGSALYLYGLLDASGASSVKQALEADKTLGGAAESLRVTGATGPTVVTIGSGPVLLAEWRVTILAVTT